MPTQSDITRFDPEPDGDNEALARRMEQAAARMEKLTTDLQKGGIERALTSALQRSQKEMEKQLTRSLRDTLLSALGGGGAGAAAGGGGLASLIGSFIPGFARGGIINRRSVIAGAGEAGAEVILPLRKGRDGRLGVVAAMQSDHRGRNAPRRVEVTLHGAGAEAAQTGFPRDDAFREAVAGAVAEALDSAIDERIALHARPGGTLDRNGGWQI